MFNCRRFTEVQRNQAITRNKTNRYRIFIVQHFILSVLFRTTLYCYILYLSYLRRNTTMLLRFANFYKMQNRMQSCAYNLFERKNSLSIIKLLSFLCYCKLLKFHHNSNTICIKWYIPNRHFDQVFKHFLEVISLQAIVISA